MSGTIGNQRSLPYLKLGCTDEAFQTVANPILSNNLETLYLKIWMAATGHFTLKDYIFHMANVLNTQTKATLGNIGIKPSC